MSACFPPQTWKYLFPDVWALEVWHTQVAGMFVFKQMSALQNILQAKCLGNPPLPPLPLLQCFPYWLLLTPSCSAYNYHIGLEVKLLFRSLLGFAWCKLIWFLSVLANSILCPLSSKHQRRFPFFHLSKHKCVRVDQFWNSDKILSDSRWWVQLIERLRVEHAGH